MRIASWNVNGIRSAIRKNFAQALADFQPDILGLQEVRASEPIGSKALNEALCPNQERWLWQLHPGSRPGYSGVGLLVSPSLVSAQDKTCTLDVHRSLDHAPFDDEGRYIEMQWGKLSVVCVYFPNGSGKARSNDRVPFKLDFYQHLRQRLLPRILASEPILVVGDFNTAYDDIDLARPKANQKTSGFLPEERKILDLWFQDGWVDTFRHIHGPIPDKYTWWSQRKGVRERNVGWRIDYILASPGAMPWLQNAQIHPDVLGSDHCPISVDMDDAIFGA